MPTRIDDRNDRPDDLGRGAVIEVRGHRALRVPELHDRIDHHAEHRDGDHHADPEDQHVQAVDVAAQLRHADRHVQLPGREAPPGGQTLRQPAAASDLRHCAMLPIFYHLHAECCAEIAADRDAAHATLYACSSKRGRFVHIPHQLLETSRETAALVLREKPAHFAGAAVRLEHESAGMQRRRAGRGV